MIALATPHYKLIKLGNNRYKIIYKGKVAHFYRCSIGWSFCIHSAQGIIVKTFPHYNITVMAILKEIEGMG